MATARFVGGLAVGVAWVLARGRVALVLAGAVLGCVCSSAALAQVPVTEITGSELRLYANLAEFESTSGAALADGLALGQVVPWIAAFAVGATLVGLVIHSDQGDIKVGPTGTGAAMARPVQLAPYNGADCWSVGGAVCPSSDSGDHIASQSVSTIVSDLEQLYGPNCTVNLSGPDGYGNYTTSGTCQGIPVNFVLTHLIQCGGGGLWFDSPANGVASCGITAPSEGGTEIWTPDTFNDPVTGQPEVGWEAPSAPEVQPQPYTPAVKIDFAPDNAVTPIARVIADPDGGVTVQTWNPEFSDPAHPTTQTGWTVQTVTTDKNGNIVSSTEVINVSSGPPATSQPTTSPTNVGPAPPPGSITCGSLDCEATQQAVHADTTQIATNTGGIHTDTTGIHTDTTGIHTDTTAILNELQANGAPTLPDQQSIVDAQKASDVSNQQSIPAGITAAQGSDHSIFQLFTWTPPSGSCAPYPVNVHGWTGSIDVCAQVGMIRDVLGFLFAIFGAWQTWGLMVKRVG